VPTSAWAKIAPAGAVHARERAGATWDLNPTTAPADLLWGQRWASGKMVRMITTGRRCEHHVGEEACKTASKHRLPIGENDPAPIGMPPPTPRILIRFSEAPSRLNRAKIFDLIVRRNLNSTELLAGRSWSSMEGLQASNSS
jgi:hypothetical protein